MAYTELGKIVAQYGYLAVLAGTLLEGETVVLAAGFLAHQGHLSIPLIIMCAIIGSGVSDQGLFFLARLRGGALLARFPRVAARVQNLADRARARPVMLTLFALLFRFFYGLRNVAPIFLGLSSLPTVRFVVLNLIGAVLWATLFSLGGYFFAKILTAVMGTLARYEVAFVALLILGGIGFKLYHRIKVKPEGKK